MNLNNPELRKRIDAMKERFETAPQHARDERDDELRAIAADFGLRQVDLVTATGYSRETVRQALNTEAREAVKASRKTWTLRIDPKVPGSFLERVLDNAGLRGKATKEGDWVTISARGPEGHDALEGVREDLINADIPAELV